MVSDEESGDVRLVAYLWWFQVAADNKLTSRFVTQPLHCSHAADGFTTFLRIGLFFVKLGLIIYTMRIFSLIY